MDDPELILRRVDINTRANAYHEAGHAVVAAHLGLRVNVAELRDSPEGENWGHVSRDYAPDDLTDAIVRLAGVAAEWRMWFPRRTWRSLRSGGDYRPIRHLPPELLDAAWRQACSVLEERWLAVNRVAAALVERGRLMGEELQRLLA